MKTERCPPAFPSSPGWRPQPVAGRQARAQRGSPPSLQPVIHRRARTPTPLSSASHSLRKTKPNCSSGRRDTPLLGSLGPRPVRGSRWSPDPLPFPGVPDAQGSLLPKRRSRPRLRDPLGQAPACSPGRTPLRAHGALPAAPALPPGARAPPSPPRTSHSTRGTHTHLTHLTHIADTTQHTLAHHTHTQDTHHTAYTHTPHTSYRRHITT